MDINVLIERCIKEAEKIGNKYNYPDNITHLLYLIISAFIIKYGNSYEKDILKCFKEIPIMIKEEKDDNYQAYYTSRPIIDNKEIKTVKGIVLCNYENITLMQLIDNLVHEFNHALNSFFNEIKTDENNIYLRTGLTYIVFNKNTLEPIKKETDFILEEIINTKQTESIIDIINSFNQVLITNTAVNNTLYAIKTSVDTNYKSNAYLLGSIVCKSLMENKTFISTLENLRFKGNVEDVIPWFDGITGIDNSYYLLSSYLNKSLTLAKEIDKTKWFRQRKINKIRSINTKAMEIVDLFDRNCNYR